MRLFLTLWLVLAGISRLEAAGTLAQFRTVKGDIVIELLDQDKPATVANFLRYVQEVYATRNMFIHRDQPGFVIQGGGYATESRTSDEEFFSFITITNFPPITNEFKVGKKVSNTYGTIAMARSAGKTNSATSQWFINLADNSADLDGVDGGFTVFGKVVSGTNVLEYFNSLSQDPRVCDFMGLVDMTCYYPNTPEVVKFSNLPVRYLGTHYPRYSDLFYVDISLYNVRVQVRPDLSREVRWNSVKSKTNIVEYTEAFPPTWKALKTFVADGSEQTVIDSAPQGGGRFYRVRVP